jgi:hypothetical protein
MKAYRAVDKARFRELDAHADEPKAEPKARLHWQQRMSYGCEQGSASLWSRIEPIFE